MSKWAVWVSRPVFITSTFADMQAERDYLRTHVFPELQERLKERFTHLEPIDLRWGVETTGSEQEQKELLVLKVCLDEIQRSRPFLIALVGDRYGWVPPEDRMRAATTEAGFETDMSRQSVTALEIEYGVLQSPNQRKRSRFYFRRPLPYDQMPTETAAKFSELHSGAGGKERHGALSALKQRVRSQMGDQVRDYSASWTPDGGIGGLEEWGRQVLRDLWEDLEEETRELAASAAKTWQEQEAVILGQFVEDGCRDFVGREGLLAELVAVATEGEDGQGLCLVGPSGSGKSAAFAKLCRILQDRGVFVLAHAAGISGPSAQPGSLLRRWIYELADHLGVPDPSQDTSSLEDLQSLFGGLLAQTARQERVVCLVDALNQFDRSPAGTHVTWVPRLPIPNVRFVATAIPGTESKALTERPWFRMQDLSALTSVESAAIVRSICARYHKTPSTRLVEALVSNAGSASPLWLEMAVQELLLLDADDFARADREFKGTPEERLNAMMIAVAESLSEDIEGLYEAMMRRAESIYGTGFARAFVDLLAVSRLGWRESDFERLIPALTREDWDPLRFAGVRRSFRAHVVQRGAQGQWAFAHAQTRAAVLRRNLPDGAAARELHSKIVDVLEAYDPSDPIRVSEKMFHLIGSRDSLRTARYYGSELDVEAAREATSRLAEAILTESAEDLNKALDWTSGLLDADGLSSSETVQLSQRFIFEFQDALSARAPLTVMLRLSASAERSARRLAEADPENAVRLRELTVGLERLGDARQAGGDLLGALSAFEESLTIMRKLAEAEEADVRWQKGLAFSLNSAGDARMALGDLTLAAEHYQESLAIRRTLAAADLSDAGRQRELAASLNRVGRVRREQGDLQGAFASHRESLQIMRSLSDADPNNTVWQSDLSAGVKALAGAREARGDLAGALDLAEESIQIMRRLAQADPGNAVWQRQLAGSLNGMGDVRRAQGDLAGALVSHEESLRIMRRLAQADPGNALWQRQLAVSLNKVGDARRAEEDLSGTLDSYVESLRIMRRLAEADPSNAVWQSDLAIGLTKVGDARQAQGDLLNVLDPYEESLGILEKLAEADPANSHGQMDLTAGLDRVADVRQALGDLSGAISSFEHSLRIRRRMAESDPSNAGWQGNLASSLEFLGDARLANGDRAEALSLFEESLRIRRTLAEADPTNAHWQRNLSVSLVKVGNARRDFGADAGYYFAECRSVLLRMREAGMPLDGQSLEVLRQLEQISRDASSNVRNRISPPPADPNQAGASRRSAFEFYRQGLYEAAATELRKALTADPSQEDLKPLLVESILRAGEELNWDENRWSRRLTQLEKDGLADVAVSLREAVAKQNEPKQKKPWWKFGRE